MRTKNLSYIGLAIALLLATSCSSGGGLGDILGGGSNQGAYNNTIRGTVDYVDVNNRSIYLVNTNYNTNLANGGSSGQSVRVAYDNNTSVVYQGQNHRPEDLERGDEVEIRVNQSGSTMVADAVTVLRDVSQASGSSTYPSYPNSSSNSNYATVRGTVRYVDTARRTIELEQTSWSSGFTGYPNGSNNNTIIVQYGTNASVDVGGRANAVSGLERGDVVDVQVDRNTNSSTYFADRITLVRDVNNR
ncbi:MAG: hypothetical protein JWO97_3195 [Acidobacteria bacterium]|nr:hypothetical protein [Acidobacteriota bacterium]